MKWINNLMFRIGKFVQLDGDEHERYKCKACNGLGWTFKPLYKQYEFSKEDK